MLRQDLHQLLSVSRICAQKECSRHRAQEWSLVTLRPHKRFPVIEPTESLELFGFSGATVSGFLLRKGLVFATGRVAEGYRGKSLNTNSTRNGAPWGTILELSRAPGLCLKFHGSSYSRFDL